MSDFLFSIFPSENFIDLGLYQYGWEQCDPAHSFGPAARNHYLFHYVISGTGTLFAQNTQKQSIEYHVRSGQGFMIFPQQICTYIANDQLPWEYVWLEFDGLKVKEMAKAAELLKLTNLSIMDVSNAVDYPHQRYFSRAFKTVYGVSPRTWMNSYK